MKESDFKLLSTLPEGWDYELLTIDGYLYALAHKDLSMIGFRIEDDKLVQIEFKEYKD
jgi:hypothetical protein